MEKSNFINAVKLRRKSGKQIEKGARRKAQGERQSAESIGYNEKVKGARRTIPGLSPLNKPSAGYLDTYIYVFYSPPSRVVCTLDTSPYSSYSFQIMTHHLLGKTE